MIEPTWLESSWPKGAGVAACESAGAAITTEAMADSAMDLSFIFDSGKLKSRDFIPGSALNTGWNLLLGYRQITDPLITFLSALKLRIMNTDRSGDNA